MTSDVWDDRRAAWGAVPSTNPITVSPTQRTGFMTHWNGGKVGITPADAHSRCLAYVKAVQTFHMGPERGWADVGYNGFVCVHGRAIEGRGIGLQGAHCPNYNVNTIGVMLITGLGDAAVPPAALARQRRLYDQCVTYAGRMLRMLGHRDGVATDCPGATLYGWVAAGMPAPQEEMFTVGQFEDLMGAVTALTSRVAALESAVGKTAQQSTVTGNQTAIIGRLDQLPADVGAKTAEAVAPAVIAALDDSLGGVEVSARYVRQKETP
jgi:hypothetical protein